MDTSDPGSPHRLGGRENSPLANGFPAPPVLRPQAGTEGTTAAFRLAAGGSLTREVSPLARANRMREAEAALAESREIYRRLGDRAGEAFSRRNEGTLLVGKGDAPGALAAFNQELVIGREIGSLIETSNAWNGIGVVRH